MSIGAQAVTATSGYANVIAEIAGASRYETAALVAEAMPLGPLLRERPGRQSPMMTAPHTTDGG